MITKSDSIKVSWTSVTAARVAGKQGRFLGLARCMELSVTHVLIALVHSLLVTVQGIGVTLTVTRLN